MIFESKHILFSMEMLAGLGLVLYALRSFSGALQTMSSRIIDCCFNRVSGHPLWAILAGAIISFFVHSRRKTMLVALSYSNVGILNLDQLIRFLVGTNIGTSLSPLVLILLPPQFSIVGIVFGTMVSLSSSKEKIKQLGFLFFYFGLALLGIKMIVFGVGQSLTLQGGWQTVLYALQDLTMPRGMNSFFWVWTGLFAGLTFLIRSSVVGILFVLIMVQLNIVSVWLALSFVLGVNLGVVSLCLLDAQMLRKKEKQASLVHFLSHLLVVLLVFCFYDLVFSKMVSLVSGLGVGEINSREGSNWVLLVGIFHVLYNLAVVAIALPLHGSLIFLVKQIVGKSTEKEQQQLIPLGTENELTPSLSVELLSQEINKLSAMVVSLLELSFEKIVKEGCDRETSVDVAKHAKKNEGAVASTEERIKKYDTIVVQMGNEISSYINALIPIKVSMEDGLRLKAFPTIVEELETVAHGCCRIMKLLDKSLLDDFESCPATAGVTKRVRRLSLDSIQFYENIFENFNLGDESPNSPRSVEMIKHKADLESQLNEALNEIIEVGSDHQQVSQWIPICLEIQNLHGAIFRLYKWTEKQRLSY